MVQVITFEPCNIFELIWYSEWPLAAELFLFGFWKNLGYQKVFFKTTDLYFFLLGAVSIENSCNFVNFFSFSNK